MSGGFWQQVVDFSMAPPSDRPLSELTAELVTMLGSADTDEREAIAYVVLANWTSAGLYDDLLRTFGDSVATGLKTGLGRVGDDSVFRRSFSALVLAKCVTRDNAASLLPIDAVFDWADQALHWYVGEKDLRGSIPGKGLASPVGAGADLLAALASSRHFAAPQLGILLDVIAERVLSTSSRVLVDGEDDRLAVAALTIMQRNLVEQDRIDAWVETLGAGLAPTIVQPTRPPSATAARNTSAFLRAVYVHLAGGIAPTDAMIGFDEPPSCRADSLLALLQVIPLFTPRLYPSLDGPVIDESMPTGA